MRFYGISIGVDQAEKCAQLATQNEDELCDARTADETSSLIVIGKGSAISNASRLGTDFNIKRPRLWLSKKVMATLTAMMHIETSGQGYVPSGPRRTDRRHSGRGSCVGHDG